MSKTDEDLNNILILLDDLVSDQSIPRISGAIFILEELVNDPSLPIHARSSIFTIIGKLEALSGAIS